MSELIDDVVDLVVANAQANVDDVGATLAHGERWYRQIVEAKVGPSLKSQLCLGFEPLLSQHGFKERLQDYFGLVHKHPGSLRGW